MYKAFKGSAEGVIGWSEKSIEAGGVCHFFQSVSFDQLFQSVPDVTVSLFSLFFD